MNKYFKLFISFAKVGILTFGGGYAMLPMLQREIVDKHGWATEEELIDYYAIGQCTPGIIAVNTATFIGKKQGGFWGSIFATFGMIFPSLIIISIIAAFISNFLDLPWVQNAFGGIRVSVCVLIASSVIKLFKKSIIDRPTMAIFIIIFVLGSLVDLSPIIFVIIAGLLGVIVKSVGGGK